MGTPSHRQVGIAFFSRGAQRPQGTHSQLKDLLRHVNDPDTYYLWQVWQQQRQETEIFAFKPIKRKQKSVSIFKLYLCNTEVTFCHKCIMGQKQRFYIE